MILVYQRCFMPSIIFADIFTNNTFLPVALRPRSAFATHAAHRDARHRFAVLRYQRLAKLPTAVRSSAVARVSPLRVANRARDPRITNAHLRNSARVHVMSACCAGARVAIRAAHALVCTSPRSCCMHVIAIRPGAGV
jgi:hypothetical protein